jgi:uncharacterized protein YlxW (UPF0749 family)
MSDPSANERFDRVDKSIEHLTQSIDRLTQYVVDLRDETTSRLQVIENRLDFLSLTVASIDSRLPALTKATLETGSLTSQLVREQARQKDSATDLASRVAKLEEKVSRFVDPAA